MSSHRPGRLRASAIIVAAGEGKRFGGEIRKPYLDLNGKPILLHSVSAFADVDAVAEIIVVVNAADMDMVKERWGEALRAVKATDICIGGATRQESVIQGLAHVAETAELVAIHDAVRPLVSPDLIRQAIETAARVGAAMLAAPVKATIKDVGSDRFIRATIPRKTLWAAQTPQVFRRDLILRAYERARRDGFQATDDAELVERLGEPVAVVESSDENIKITTPDDLLLARALAAHLGGRSFPK
ncbi:MAG: 2-C-methyl-D-erythritol 4-phosphate cytidylyltransferase [Planctomycetota bacterium]